MPTRLICDERKNETERGSMSVMDMLLSALACRHVGFQVVHLVAGERLSLPPSVKGISVGSPVAGARLSLPPSSKDISGGSPVAGERLSSPHSNKDISGGERMSPF